MGDTGPKAKKYAIPEVMMGLPVSQRRILGEIEQAIEVSDPQLTSMFTTFSRLSRNEHMPAGERLRTHTWLLLAAVRRRLRSGAPARLTGWLCYPIAALILVVMIVMTAHSGGATCTGATPPGAARHHAQIKTCAPAGNSALLHGR
jgi:hypothetical protein